MNFNYPIVMRLIMCAGNSPYSRTNKVVRHPSEAAKIGRMYGSNENQCARYEVAVINSIFKHSEGYVMTTWNNNADEYHITDIFGTPEDGKHILAEEHKCSDKGKFNLALAYRQGSSSAKNGYCFNNAKAGEANNCICSDRSGGGRLDFNKCNGEYMYAGKNASVCSRCVYVSFMCGFSAQHRDCSTPCADRVLTVCFSLHAHRRLRQLATVQRKESKERMVFGDARQMCFYPGEDDRVMVAVLLLWVVRMQECGF